jgi:site-specific DNA-methyltransferase (adenine-specific)
MSSGKIYLADSLDILRMIPDESVDLVYIDPPFNTGKTRTRGKAKYIRSENGDRIGFGGHEYIVQDLGENLSYGDSFESEAQYLAFLNLRVREIHRILKPTGTFYLHLDDREAAYARVFVGDPIFGRDNFMNEVIWAFDYGAKPKNRWPRKHNNIMVWAKQFGSHIFNINDIDREPYMAPGMVDSVKASKGKLPTSCWWHTIVSPTGKEKTGYPTQKPLGILERIIRASSPVGGIVLDCFGGSGTTGEAALRLNRKFILIDQNPEAIRVMKRRFSPYREAGHDVRFIKRYWKGADDADAGRDDVGAAGSGDPASDPGVRDSF